ncbi:hypothetical protein FPOAC2_04054 [Fusarium poae]|jgi:hypothetical protein|uniref:hypothetical protein n=1 Tax=Fusarium poae TaxID=36050 RepID=UPI001CE88385|nr:hypothetical protein FPOAC1_003989 [Fusarium poae]KAG8670755.1 hypothetical protein FPOAC1_003989 [Fusarium poae]
MEPLMRSFPPDMALSNERGDMNRHHAASASDSGVVTRAAHDYQQVPQSYHGFGDESIWQDFSSKKRSAEYHLNKVSECLYSLEGPDGEITVMERQDVVCLGQHDVNRNSQCPWRLKVEYDKATRDLIAMENILNILKSSNSSTAEVGSHFVKAVTSLTIFSGSCFIASKNHDQIWGTGALAGALVGGYCMAKSSYRGTYGYLRTTALERCLRIVTSLRNRLQHRAPEKEDCTSFKSYWFSVLDLFRPEDGMDGDDVSANIRHAPQNSYLAAGYRNDTRIYTIE